MLPDSLTVGVVQFKPEWGNVERNLSMTSRVFDDADSKGCEVVVLPEMWPTGMYGDLDMHRFKQPIPGLYTDYLAEQATKHSVYVIAGLPERGVKGALHNAAVLIGPEGKILARHRKVHPYSLLGEEKIWTPGDQFTVVDTRIGRVGLLICYDGDFPESWRANALMGAEIVFHISAYETPCEDWWEKFYPAAAFQNVIWSVQCNTVGDTVMTGKPLHFFGRSRIIAPDGEISAQAPNVSPGEEASTFLLVKTLDARKRFEENRTKFGNFLVDRRPELYSAISKGKRAPSRARKRQRR